MPTDALFDPGHFGTFDIPVPADASEGRVTIHGVHGRNQDPNAPAVLLLHGYPQNLNIWHKVAPTLIKHFHVVATDLRGYGQSSKPPRGPDDANYTKRETANDQVRVMQQLGYQHFYILAHDRGARVAHRLVLDHPERVLKLILLDIAPTAHMYKTADSAFADKYYHWFLFIQPYPTPEILLSQPRARDFTRLHLTKGGNFFDEAALASYLATSDDERYIEGSMADYRASRPGGPDLTLDAQDQAQGNKIARPFKVLWGSKGVVGNLGPEAAWQAVAADHMFQGGRAVESGHYIPEELPDPVAQEALDFFR